MQSCDAGRAGGVAFSRPGLAPIGRAHRDERAETEFRTGICFPFCHMQWEGTQ